MPKRIATLATLAMLLAGCAVDATVTVDMDEDGSGAVTVALALDPGAVQAAEAGGAKLEQRVRLADLEAAGWRVGTWKRADDGSATLELSKRFTSPDQVAGIVAEINGEHGPLRDVRAARDRGLLATHYEVTGSVDLGVIQTGIGADPELVASLANQQVDVAAIDQSLLQRVRDALSVELAANLPDGTASAQGVAGERVDLDATSTVRDSRRILLIVVAIALLVLAVVVFFGGRHSRARARARAPIPRFDPHGPPR